jgi:5-formyltetrahydrofolate cyclo-ligase
MKNKLRKELKINRNKLSKKEIINKSKIIKQKLFELGVFKKSHLILFYVSYDNEVFTHDMLMNCLKKKEVIVPLSDTNNENLILSKLEKWEDLIEGAYGILEPSKIIETPIGKLDLIIVPGVGFDEKGNRLGHGKGYYDKLLQKSKATKIGLAFECQIINQIPTDKNDMPVDAIITEKRIINCKH